MEALARIQQIQAQAAAITRAVRPASFGAHLAAAGGAPATNTSQYTAASTATRTNPAGPHEITMRAFPQLDRTNASPGTASPITPRQSSLDIPSGVQLPAKADAWLGEIEAAANRYGLPPNLLTALVWSESAFNADAVSHAGAIGLSQLMPGTAAGMNVDPHDPIQNLEGGARYLAAQLDRFESIELALAAYNAGPSRVSRAGGIPDITETQNYVEIVTRRYHALEGETS